MEKFVILKDHLTFVKRFNISGRKVEFKIAAPPVNAEPTSWIKSAIDDIVQFAVQGLDAKDQVGLTFCDESFIERGPGWINFKEASLLKSSDVWEMISKIFQSNSEGINTDTFCLAVTSVRLPHGKGNNRARKYNSFNEESVKRKGIVTITNKDNLCLPRALIVAIAALTKDPNYKKVISDIGKVQTCRAEELLTKSQINIPTDGSGIPELEKFQEYLKDYKIVVYKYGSKGKDVLFEGRYDGPRLNLLYHKGHYNVITSLTAAFCCSYYCEQCKKPYNTKGAHRCGGTCPCCQKSPACIKRNIEVPCEDCNRSFRDQQCYDNHLASGSSNSYSVCSQVKRCVKCLKTYNMKQNHICGEIFCKVCRKNVQQNHLCFIQTDCRTPPTKDMLC